MKTIAITPYQIFGRGKRKKITRKMRRLLRRGKAKINQDKQFFNNK